MSGALQAVFQNQRSFAVTGQQAYTTAGTYSWVAPTGVTSVSIVCVGAGSNGTQNRGGYGGGLGYKNNYSVTPGNSYTVVVGNAGSSGADSYFVNTSTVKGGGAPAYNGSSGQLGGSYTGDGGGYGGGRPGANNFYGGGGAGGYAGSGGTGASAYSTQAQSGSGGGAGGGGRGRVEVDFQEQDALAGGGGVGILGQGSNGSGGIGYNLGSASGGGGGSGGTDGGTTSAGAVGSGGYYGGGGGGRGDGAALGYGRLGAVRIIWPGNTRSFPSTNTGDL